MLATLIAMSWLSHGEEVFPHKPFSTFPKTIGEWNGKESFFDRKIYEILGVDDSILCNYATGDGRAVQLYVGFYQSQKEGDLIHSPKNCMPGAGWGIVESSLEEVEAPGTETGKITVIKLLLQNGPAKQMVLYWFQSRGRIISSEYLQKIYLVLDSISRHRTDGSFVRLITPVAGGDEEKALEVLKGFTRQVFPLLNAFIPS